MIDDNGKIEDDPIKISNILNDYFISKTEDIRKNTINNNEDPIERVRKMVGDKLDNSKPFELKPINRNTLRK